MTDREYAERREDARSQVRVVLTYAAGAYAFGGGLLLVAAALLPGFDQTVAFAKDVYLSILPTAGSVVGYWFASRSERRNKDGEERGS